MNILLVAPVVEFCVFVFIVLSAAMFFDRVVASSVDKAHFLTFVRS
jgi:hypothetical protein